MDLTYGESRNRDSRKIYAVVNPISGNADPDAVSKALDALCEELGWTHEIYTITGADDEDVSQLTRAAVQDGANLVIASGGDGTVAGVMNGVVNSDVPLAIIPAGTGNGLARAMHIPLDVEAAVQLLKGQHRVYTIDTMQVGDKYFALNVSAGISSRAMENTETEAKKRLGVLAYAQTIAKDLLNNEPQVFDLVLDEMAVRLRASEVLVTNSEILTTPPYVFGERRYFNDGMLNVNILTARTAVDYVRLARDLLLDPEGPKSEVHDLEVHRHIRIDVEGEPQPVQGDGETIGMTPVDIVLVPKSLKIIVPEEEE